MSQTVNFQGQEIPLFDWFECTFKCPKCGAGWDEHKKLSESKEYDVYSCFGKSEQVVAVGIICKEGSA